MAAMERVLTVSQLAMEDGCRPEAIGPGLRIVWTLK